MPVDVALIQCTPPDKFGYVNLGVSVDVVMAAIEAARLVIAEINPNVPYVYGAGFVKMDRIDAWVWNDAPLLEHLPEEPGDGRAGDRPQRRVPHRGRQHAAGRASA